MTLRGNVDTLSELESAITPDAVRQWLAAQRWSLSKEKPGVAELWTSVVANPGGVENVFIPVKTEYRDFNRRFKELLFDLRQAYELDLESLVEEIAAVSADIFFIRVGQTGLDGTIPFKQAASLLTAVQKMVKAAATTTANPNHSHLGRLPAQVTEFIEDDLRFGHTKRGSFIITVAARLDEPASSVERLDGVRVLSADGEIDTESETVLEEHTESGPVKPFSRRVMETLAIGLNATKHHISQSSDIQKYEGFDAARESGMSLQLVQSLLDVAGTEGLASVDLSFQWAAAGPTPPASLDEVVTISASEFEQLEDVRDRLVVKEEPSEETLIGRIAELGRDEVSGLEQPWITLEAELYGRTRKIRVDLDPSDYEWAIFAHQRRLPFTVSGTPIRHQRWALEGVITADTRFLRDVAVSDPSPVENRQDDSQ